MAVGLGDAEVSQLCYEGVTFLLDTEMPPTAFLQQNLNKVCRFLREKLKNSTSKVSVWIRSKHPVFISLSLILIIPIAFTTQTFCNDLANPF